jgi:hypothetical protein
MHRWYSAVRSGDQRIEQGMYPRSLEKKSPAALFSQRAAGSTAENSAVFA